LDPNLFSSGSAIYYSSKLILFIYGKQFNLSFGLWRGANLQWHFDINIHPLVENLIQVILLPDFVCIVFSNSIHRLNAPDLYKPLLQKNVLSQTWTLFQFLFRNQLYLHPYFGTWRNTSIPFQKISVPITPSAYARSASWSFGSWHLFHIGSAYHGQFYTPAFFSRNQHSLLLEAKSLHKAYVSYYLLMLDIEQVEIVSQRLPLNQNIIPNHTRHKNYQTIDVQSHESATLRQRSLQIYHANFTVEYRKSTIPSRRLHCWDWILANFR